MKVWRFSRETGIIIVLIAACFLSLSGCTRQEEADENIQDLVTGKTYIYEKEGFGGDFTIQIEKDGTFSYYEGALSSYYGTGKWTLDSDILCLSDDVQMGYPFINYFKVDGNDLIFLSENSSGFTYIDVLEGEKFSAN